MPFATYAELEAAMADTLAEILGKIDAGKIRNADEVAIAYAAAHLEAHPRPKNPYGRDPLATIQARVYSPCIAAIRLRYGDDAAQRYLNANGIQAALATR